MKTLKDLNIKTLEALRKLSTEKLNDELKASQKTLYTMNMKLVAGEQKQTHVIKAMRRYIASLKTLQAQVQN
jgi:ribosomal protein L29